VGNQKNVGVAIVAGIILLLLIFGDFSIGDPIPTVDCDFDTAGTAVNVSCFRVETETDSLAVAVLHRDRHPLEEPPVLVLPAIPGSTPLSRLTDYDSLPILGDRDVVVVDPPGTGASGETLACAIEPTEIDLLRRCREDMIDAGTALEEYGTARFVTALEEVRRALAEGRTWSRWHVVAAGYGNRVATRLAALDRVQTLTLTQVVPEDTPVMIARARAYPAALDAVASACTGWCPGKGEVTARVNRIAERLDRHPEPIELVPPDGDATVVGFDAGLFRSAVSHALEEPSLVAVFPWATERIDRAASEFGLRSEGRLALAGLGSNLPVGPEVSPALFWTITCGEEVTDANLPIIGDWYSTTPELLAPLDPSEACGAWTMNRIEREPTVTRLGRPTLVVEATVDAASVADWAEDFASRIEDATLVSVPVATSPPGLESCTARILSRFMDSGEPPTEACPSLHFNAFSVPVAGVRYRPIGGELGAIIMAIFGTTLAAVFTLWAWRSAPSSSTRTAWTVTAGTLAIFLPMAGAILVTVDRPSTLLAQPPPTWAVFILPWIAIVTFVFATARTVIEIRAGQIDEYWPARYTALAIGVVLGLCGAIFAGLVPSPF